jgi:hypothetical protein
MHQPQSSREHAAEIARLRRQLTESLREVEELR